MCGSILSQVHCHPGPNALKILVIHTPFKIFVLKVLLGVMSEQLCLQWNDFKENVISAFGNLRNDKEFTDVTLACEDGKQMEAHKVIGLLQVHSFRRYLRTTNIPIH